MRPQMRESGCDFGCVHCGRGDRQQHPGCLTIGNYLIVQDTKLDRIRRKPHGKAAVNAFLKTDEGKHFVVDASRLLYTQHHGGYLRRTR